MTTTSTIGTRRRVKNWRAKAECRPGSGHDPELWFPRPPNPYTTRSEQKATTLKRREQERRAKAICRRCRVRLECLRYAIEHDERSGIWGGETPQERGASPIR